MRRLGAKERSIRLASLTSTLLLAGDRWDELVRHALRLTSLDGRVTLAESAAIQPSDSDPDSLAAAVRIELDRAGATFQCVPAPRSGVASLLASRGHGWTTIDVSERGDRLASVRLPAEICSGGPLIAINDLARFDPKRPAIAIGLWAQFAHPRQRFGAAAGDVRDGLVAEIALAAPPALYLIGASWRGKPMVVATRDMIAAELIALAIGQAQADPDRELAGPWEHPLVQRAAELGLGAQIPDQIEFRGVWLGADTAVPGFCAFADRISMRLGISDAPSFPVERGLH